MNMLCWHCFLLILVLVPALGTSASPLDPPLLDDTSVYGPNAKRDFNIIVYSFIVAFTISTVGCLYLFYRVYMRWQLKGYSSIPIAVRYPFYMAITDFVLCLCVLMNFNYTRVHKMPLEGIPCKIVGFASVFVVPWDVSTVTVISVITYFRICRRTPLDTGRYDWKMFAAALPLPIAAVTIGRNEIGPAGYWCGSAYYAKFIPVFILITTSMLFLVVLFCYICIIMTIRTIGNKLATAESRSVNSIEWRVSKKIASYVLIFLLKNLPLVLFYTLAIIKDTKTWQIELIAFGLSIGVSGNVIQYINNEGWNPKNSSSFGSAPTLGENTNDDSKCIAINVSQQTVTLPDDNMRNNNANWHKTLAAVGEISDDSDNDEMMDEYDISITERRT